MSASPEAEGEGIPLSDAQRLAWLRLIRSDNVGPATFRDLINHFGSAARAIEMLPDLAARGGSRRIRIATSSDAEAEMETAERFGAQFVGMGEPDYPPALRMVDGAPPLLAMCGDLTLTHRPAVGMVGSRNASAVGCRIATSLTRAIGAAGYVLVSGMARGIDAAAHAAAVETGTIAAMAGGLDRPYPPQNAALYERMRSGAGLVVSEMPFGWEPRARDFPRRNRLIAGIALGLVVIEAAKRSGSLITARQAADFGRLVFAVPGSPLDPRAGGTNGLLKDGASMVTESADVLDALAPLGALPVEKRPSVAEPDMTSFPAAPPDEGERSRIVDALDMTPVAVDALIQHTAAPTAAVHLVLLELDLAGRLHRHPGGLVSLAPTAGLS
ncbi:DNA-processing protein DprA [Pararhizobium mangrovi]|uniref:DNA-protecting protein DprA n=1 Tax=Pararhizobium mangrovi TaxID=2590452 RepID=A0A506TXT8_9HYPH|nr:DNA-processing protein DprA [Pararhizobium mangrovi]TPW26126.1 DNA-protecting protein DprA [Pararhizobium mangrovi]